MNGKRIYFVTDKDHVKIGSSSDPEARLASLQTGTAKKLVLLGHRPGGERGERFLHDVFAKDRAIGEWFHLSDSMRDFLLNVAQFGWTEDMSAEEAVDVWRELIAAREKYNGVLYKKTDWAAAVQHG